MGSFAFLLGPVFTWPRDQPRRAPDAFRPPSKPVRPLANHRPYITRPRDRSSDAREPTTSADVRAGARRGGTRVAPPRLPSASAAARYARGERITDPGPSATPARR